MHIEVNANGFERWDKPVEIALDTGALIARVLEIDDVGTVIRPAVPFQHDAEGLVILLTGATPADATRHFRVEFGPDAADAEPLVTLVDGVEDEDQESYQVITPAATWFYHKLGAGFSSLLDRDGLDWLGYRPGGGSAGEYRGIPNMGYPEGYCHPGKTVSHSHVIASGPLCARIESTSNDGKMRCRWDVFPNYARLTVLEMRTPYWFLYEGTPGGNPGGQLDEANGYCVRSDGTRAPLSERWDGPLPAPEWLYFGAGNVDRVLYLVHHEADEEIDSYWPMEHNMTVFGFGRLGLDKFMTRVPAHFTVGFAEDGTFERAQSVIDSAFRPLHVTTLP
jgi:hypothetical protein